MKKGILIILLILIGAISYFFSPISNYKCPPPERPNNVPVNAKWCGGCDGGDWIYFVTDDKPFHFIVYRDWDGEVKIDGLFLPENNEITLTYDNWKDQVVYYAHDIDSMVYIIIEDSIQITKLIWQYPHFGGSDWYTIKDKYDIK